jgi:hypothetical protein
VCLSAGALACSWSPCSNGSYGIAGKGQPVIYMGEHRYAMCHFSDSQSTCAHIRYHFLSRPDTWQARHSKQAQPLANMHRHTQARFARHIHSPWRVHRCVAGQGRIGRRTRNAGRARPDPQPSPQVRPTARRTVRGWAEHRRMCNSTRKLVSCRPARKFKPWEAQG